MNGTLIRQALVHYFAVEEAPEANIDTIQLVSLLRRLPAVMIPGKMEPLAQQLQRNSPGVVLHSEQAATLRFVDEVVNAALRETDLEFKVECLARYLTPLIAAEMIREGHRAIQKNSRIFDLFDLLLEECQGWSEDLGALGDDFISRWEDRIIALANGRLSIKDCLDQLQEYQKKQDYLGSRREAALAADEVAHLESLRARSHAGQLLNSAMAGKRLPLFSIFVLQGAWYQFLQTLSTHYGQSSVQWRNAERITRALVMSLQPDATRHLRDQVPAKIQDWCEGLRFDTSAIDNCLSDITSEYQNLDGENFERLCVADPIKLDDIGQGDIAYSPGAKELMLMRSLRPGQWVLYDSPGESREKSARLRLILNWEAGENLVFTNLNRRKTLHLSYAKVAGCLNNGAIKLIDPELDVRSAIEQTFREVLEGLRENRRCQRQRQVVELESHMHTKKLRAVALRRKAEQKLDAAARAVATLRPDAWVKLPVMEGALTPCKLVAILPGSGNYVFANRAGVKIGEYSPRRLADMLVTENSAILDTGEEFERTLEDIVTGVRENRDRGFLELTAG